MCVILCLLSSMSDRLKITLSGMDFSIDAAHEVDWHLCHCSVLAESNVVPSLVWLRLTTTATTTPV